MEDTQYLIISSKYQLQEIAAKKFTGSPLLIEDRKVYRPELAFLLTSKELPVSNLQTGEDELIDGTAYIDSYLQGYDKGVEFFEKKIMVSPDTLWNNQSFIDNLYEQYYNSEIEGYYKGWQFIKLSNGYPQAITHKEVQKFAYYAGIVSCVDKLIEQNKPLFSSFPTPKETPMLLVQEMICPYFSKCESPIRREDTSCFPKCSIYQNWYSLISKHLHFFDRTYFSYEDVIKKLQAIEDIIERLDYWLQNYNYPVYQWIQDLSIHDDEKMNLRDFQNRLKYGKYLNYYEIGYPSKGIGNAKIGRDDDLIMGSWYIPRIVYNQCFIEWENSPKLSFWVLEYSAKKYFQNELKAHQWEKRLKNNPIQEIKKKLKELNDFEERANQLYENNQITDIYKEKQEYSEYTNYHNEIELLRIKADYYKEHSFTDQQRPSEIAMLYGIHIYFKEYLENELSKRTNSLPIDSTPLPNTNKNLPNVNKTKTSILTKTLGEHEFFELKKVKALSKDNQQELIKLISIKPLPYKIAMFHFLGYLQYLENEHFNTKKVLHKTISNWFNSDKDGRSIRGNINVLYYASAENNKRYTAHIYKEKVEKDYNLLK